MKIAVTGASGFIGKHVLMALARRTGTITALSRHTDHASMPGVSWRTLDIADCADPFDAMGRPDVLIHLAWDGLPNYRSPYHVETELPRQYGFLKRAVEGGLRSVFASGTCFEYGMQSGALHETTPCQPDNPYGLAKHALQQQLSQLRQTLPFALTWGRLFYMYGPGQNPKSLWPLFQDAHGRGATVFDMSGGAQLRDYLSVETLAEMIVTVALDHPDSGIVNLSSGKPIAVRDLVTGWAKALEWDVRLNLGYYPYPDYEPMEFWGDNTKLRYLLEPARKAG